MPSGYYSHSSLTTRLWFLDMATGNGFSKGTNAGGTGDLQLPGNGQLGSRVHPAWLAFVRFCQHLQHGEIECLKIQDGLPVLAEVTTKKVKFT